jgi:Family of unknown function (DUF6084)
MPDLDFQVEGAEAAPYAEAPLLNLKLRVINRVAGEAIHSVMLRCQIMIEAVRRRYNESEAAGLKDLFSEPDQWGRTLRSTLWTNSGVIVPSFTDGVTVDLPVPCTFDFNVAATKYFAALQSGDAPLLLLFNGTVFYTAESGALQVTQIPWEKEARYRLPVRAWREMMDTYYPNSAWLCLRRDVFERLYTYKTRRGIPTFEQALESVIPDVSEEMKGPEIGGLNAKETIH